MVVKVIPMPEQAIFHTETREPEGLSSVLVAFAMPPIRTETFDFATTAAPQFWDLTGLVETFVSRSGVTSGQVTVFTPHTTTSIVVNEVETGFFNDFGRAIDCLVPKDAYYEHDDHGVRTENLQEDEYVNGHAHCRQLLVGQPSVTVPVVSGKILLGRWQRVLFVEFDQARQRRAIFHVQGV